MKTISLVIIPLLVLAPSLAYATNEGSYLYGKQQGKSEWNCIHKDNGANCQTDPNFDCNNSHYFTKDSMGLWVAGPPIVTNYTACADGFYHVFNHMKS